MGYSRINWLTNQGQQITAYQQSLKPDAYLLLKDLLKGNFDVDAIALSLATDPQPNRVNW